MTATPLPLFALSHTIKGTATIRCRNGVPTDYLISLANVRLWTDPIYGTALKVVDSPCLLGRLAYLMEAFSPDPGTYSKDYGFIAPNTYFPAITVAGSTLGMRGSDAATNDAGRLILQRLGVPPYYNNAAGASVLFSSHLEGVWNSPEAESGDREEFEKGFGEIVETRNGFAYTFNVGQPLKRRTVVLEAIAAQNAVNRTGMEAGFNLPPDTSFKQTIWPWLERGESVRYYADQAAQKTYLTSAVLVSDMTITVASTTGMTTTGNIWVNGERMELNGVASGTTLNVYRDHPIAHRKYDPVSKDFVATYILDKSGGTIAREQFNPKLRAIDSDFYDLVIPLVRSAA